MSQGGNAAFVVVQAPLEIPGDVVSLRSPSSSSSSSVQRWKPPPVINKACLHGCSTAAVALVFGLMQSRGRKQRRVTSTCATTTSTTTASSKARTSLTRSTRESTHYDLVSEVTLVNVWPHPSVEDLEIAKVGDPDFVGAMLQLVVEAGRWKPGDKGMLLKVGSEIPRKVASFSGSFKELFGLALASKGGALEGPVILAGAASQGLLLPFPEQEESNRTSFIDQLRHIVKPIEWLQARIVFEIAFRGDGFRGSCGSEQSVEFALRSALLQVGVVPAYQKPAFLRLSRTDAGVHARSFRISAPLIRLKAADIQQDGSCPGLTNVLNRRLPPTLRILQVTRVAFNADLAGACTAREYRYYLPRSLFFTAAGEVDFGFEERFAARLKSCEGQRCFFNFTRPEVYAALEERMKMMSDTDRWFQDFKGFKRSRREKGFPINTRVAEQASLKTIPEVAVNMTTRKLCSCELLPAVSIARSESFGANNTSEEFLCVRLVGEGFLSSMVRMLVGVCCAAARDVLPMEEFEAALQAEEVVDVAEFLAPAQGLILHDQHLDQEKLPWFPVDRCAGAADAFQSDHIFPMLQQAWQKSPSMGTWFRPSSRLIEQDGVEDWDD